MTGTNLIASPFCHFADVLVFTFSGLKKTLMH